VAVARVHHALPRDGGGVNVQPHELGPLLRRHGVRVRRRDAQLGGAPLHDGAKEPLALLVGGEQARKHDLVRHVLLVEHARVDGRRQQVVGRRDGVDVARQVQVELLHGDDLRIPAALQVVVG